MGVRNLLWYLCSGGSSLLDEHKLCRTTLIVDGSNVCPLLYKKYFGKCSVFGGDYGDLYSRVAEFFGRLLTCEVDPIVLFDGLQPELKSEVRRDRREKKLENLAKLRGGKSSVIAPIFLFDVFANVLADMGIRHLQLHGEADRELAALARHYKCPVLSDDSDFFIYDVDFIPVKGMDDAPTRDHDGSLHFRCRLYRSGNVFGEFPGLDKEVLPVIAVVSDNDPAVKTSAVPRSENVADVLKWLQTSGDLESVITKILGGSGDVSAEMKIREVVDYYRKPFPVTLSGLEGENRGKWYKMLEAGGLLSGLPTELLESFERCKLGRFVLSLTLQRRCDLGVQVEDAHQISAHSPSVRIIREIYEILRACTGAPEKITVNIRDGGVFADRVYGDGDGTSARLTRDVLDESEDRRRDLFFEALGMNPSDRQVLGNFDPDWALFVTSVKYWKRETGELEEAHVSAVLLMALYNYVRSMFDRAEEDRRKANAAGLFPDLLEQIPREEYEKVRDGFRKFHTRISNGKNGSVWRVFAREYFFPTVHVFASLQSVLCHILQFNHVLGEPLREFRVSRFYSGTFLFYVLAGWRGFAEEVVSDLPRMLEAYKFLDASVSSASARGE